MVNLDNVIISLLFAFVICFLIYNVRKINRIIYLKCLYKKEHIKLRIIEYLLYLLFIFIISIFTIYVYEVNLVDNCKLYNNYYFMFYDTIRCK
jgi:hypothetical protein